MIETSLTRTDDGADDATGALEQAASANIILATWAARVWTSLIPREIATGVPVHDSNGFAELAGPMGGRDSRGGVPGQAAVYTLYV